MIHDKVNIGLSGYDRSNNDRKRQLEVRDAGYLATVTGIKQHIIEVQYCQVSMLNVTQNSRDLG